MSAANATATMKTFGDTTSVKIIRRINPVLDPVLGTITEDSIQIIDVLAVIGRVPDSAIDGTRIFQGDKQITISAETPVIESDLIEIDGNENKIIMIDAPKMLGQILYYKVICRA